MRNNGIIRPNAMNMETIYAQGPLAQPACTVLQGQGEMKMIVMGGLTKVEALAGQIAAGVFTKASPNEAGFIDVDVLARDAVEFAEAILAECQRRAKERQTHNEPNDNE